MMDPWHIALFATLALLAEIVGTEGGFGSSLFFVPIAGYFLDFHSVLGVTALFHISSNISKIVFFRRGFDRRLAVIIGVPAVVFVIAGAVLSRFFAPYFLEIGLAFFLIILSLVLLLFKRLEVRPNLPNAVAGGAMSGLMSGIFGTGGAIRGITLAAFNLKTDVFIATSAIIDLAIDASRAVVYTVNGYVHGQDLYLVAILFVAGIGGTYAGKVILEFVTETQFKTIVLFLVLATGLFTLFKVWFK